MTILLQNESIKATISTLGAELVHLEMRNTNTDYMWKGDPAYWGGRSPVLFPIIGSLNDGVVMIDGQSFTMGNHGFARKTEFECVAHDDLSATFRLEESDITLTQYPYRFTLDLIYTLIGTAVSIRYVITNKNDQVMPFQIGTHPAFNCPIGTSESLTDWYLEFEKPETLSRIGLVDNLLNFDRIDLVMDNSTVLPLNPEDFYEGAMVFKSVASSHVTLKSDKTPEKVTVSFRNLPDLALWQPKDAPFLCIEPWYGHGDPIGFDGDILEKIGMVHLEGKQIYEAELRIRIS